MNKNFLIENSNKFLYVFSDCIPVFGKKNFALYDLTRINVHLFPNSFFDLFNFFNKETIGSIFNNIEDIYKNSFNEFIIFLLDNELAIFFDDLSMFPEIEIIWETPNLISNSIIDVNDKLHDFGSIFNQLDELGCDFVQLRFYSNKHSIDTIDEILSLAFDKSITSIELLLMYNSELSKTNYVKLFEKHQIISSLIVHSCNFDKKVKTIFGYKGENQGIINSIEKEVIFTSQKISSCDHCGIINEKYLSISDVSSFMENVLYNGCLNKKISIDENGLIKNCPSMKNSFGNINNTKLSKVIKNDIFKKYWNINKDQIEVCKDCELRYLCTDCRAFIEEPTNPYSKPLKCGYNPYTNEWEEWSTNPLKQKAIEFYGMQDLVKKDA